MATKKRGGKFFYRMIFSYTLMILTVTLAVALVSTGFSRRIIFSEIAKFNERMLESASEKIRSRIVDPARAIPLDLVLTQGELLGRSAIREDSVALLELHTVLKNTVIKHSNSIDRLHVYFRQENTMVSSSYGYKDFNTRRPEGDYAWLTGVLERPGAALHTEGDPGEEASRRFLSFPSTYPFGAGGEGAAACIITTVDEAKLRECLTDSFSHQYNSTFVIDRQGVILSHPDPLVFGTAIPPDYLSQIEFDKASDLRSFSQEGGDYLFSYYNIPSTGWYIVNIVSIRDFYAPYFSMRWQVGIISAIVVAVGIQLAILVSRYFYTPIEKLSRKAAENFGAELRSQHGELGIIEGAIDRMSLRIDTLQSVLRHNAPVMRQNFLGYLLEGTFRCREEIGSRLQMLELPPEYGRALCFVVSFDTPAMEKLPLAERQVLRLGMLERLNCGDREAGWFCVAGDITDTLAAGAVSCGSHDREALQHIGEICAESLLGLSVGGVVDSLGDLCRSRDQAMICVRYRFFCPDAPVLEWREIRHRHESEQELSRETLEGITGCTELPGLLAAFEEVVGELKRGPYNIDYVNRTLLSLLQAISARSVHTTGVGMDARKEQLRRSFLEADSIDYLVDWMRDYVRSICFQAEDAPAQSTLAQVKAYVEENLAGDLSLEAVSSRIYISPKYLSRVFKDLTGQNLSDYITGRRIERAARLLEGTSQTIEAITGKVGYNSSAYFIKRFKEATGLTPKQYRKQQLERRR